MSVNDASYRVEIGASAFMFQVDVSFHTGNAARSSAGGIGGRRALRDQSRRAETAAADEIRQVVDVFAARLDVVAAARVKRQCQVVAHRRQVLVVMLHDGADRISRERHARRRAPPERGNAQDVWIRPALESGKRMVVAVEVAVAGLDDIDHPVVQHGRPDTLVLLGEPLVRRAPLTDARRAATGQELLVVAVAAQRQPVLRRELDIPFQPPDVLRARRRDVHVERRERAVGREDEHLRLALVLVVAKKCTRSLMIGPPNVVLTC